MAFTPTILQEGILDIRAVAGLSFQQNELRRSRYGALEAANVGVGQLVPASTLEDMKQASSQVTSIDVFARLADGAGVARKCAGTGTGTTANIDLAYSTFVEEFSISDLEHRGNRAKMQESFNYLLRERLRSLHNRIDSAAVTALEAVAVPLAGTFGVTGVFTVNEQEVANADRLSFYNQMKTNLQENDFFGAYDNVHSTSQGELVRFDQAQGGANATNLEFQLGDYSHFATNNLTPALTAIGVSAESTSYMFERGTFGVLTWTNQLHRAGKDIGTDVWTTMEDPFGLLGTIELKIKESCADNGVGKEADAVTSYVMSIEVAFPTAFDSTGTDSGIYKASIAA